MNMIEALAKIAALEAEVERWMALHQALLDETGRSADQWAALVDKWRQEREATEALVHRMGERLAAFEVGCTGPRTH